MTDELKPCPFCGGEAKVMRDKCSGVYFIGCSNDKCLGFSAIGWSYETAEEAIEAWNTRAERTCRNVAEKGVLFECSDCVHKNVCFHNGIKCDEFICSDIQPKSKERTCKLNQEGFDIAAVAVCDKCGDRFSVYAMAPEMFNYCPNCGAKVE